MVYLTTNNNATSNLCRYVYEDAERVWNYHDKNGDDSVEWEEYKHTAFGTIEGKPHAGCAAGVTLPFLRNMWQSENKHYFIAYFDHVTAFKALYL